MTLLARLLTPLTALVRFPADMLADIGDDHTETTYLARAEAAEQKEQP